MKTKNEIEILNSFKIEELEQRFELRPWLKPHNPKDVGCIIIINARTVDPTVGGDGTYLIDTNEARVERVSDGYSVNGELYSPDARGVYHFGDEGYIEVGENRFDKVGQ